MPLDDLTSLPLDDADARLARRIDEEGALNHDDSFEGLLASYRDAAHASALPPGFSERLWARVAPRPSPLRLLPTWTRWAAVAAVILIAYAFWATRNQGPELLASASSVIVSVSLEDGSVVQLRPHTQFYRTASNSYLLDGEAFFSVTHHPERQFVVRSKLGEIRVIGTRFDVSTWGGETDVFLEQGGLVFKHLPTGRLDTLAAGEEVVASAKGLERTRAADQGRGALDWLNNALVFGERPLTRIIAEMEHHFDITVLVPDSLKTETLSGQILLSTPEESLRDLGTALGGRFEQARPNVFRLSFD
jgi:transmembrane sensor